MSTQIRLPAPAQRGLPHIKHTRIPWGCWWWWFGRSVFFVWVVLSCVKLCLVASLASIRNPDWLLWHCCVGLSENLAPAQHGFHHLQHLEDRGLEGVSDYCILEVTEKLVGGSNLFARLKNIIIKQPASPYSGNADITDNWQESNKSRVSLGSSGWHHQN